MRLKWISWLRSTTMQQALSRVPQVAFPPTTLSKYLRSRSMFLNAKNVPFFDAWCLCKECPTSFWNNATYLWWYLWPKYFPVQFEVNIGNYFLLLIDKSTTPLTSFCTTAKYLDIGPCCCRRRFAKQSLRYEISLLLFKARCSFIPPNLQTKSSSTEVQYDTTSTTHMCVCEYYQQLKCASLIQKGGLVFVGHVLFSVVSFKSTIMKKAAFLEF